MNPSDVIQFLQENPDFFDRNSALLTDLTVTHPNNGQAISLTERQLIALRDRIAQLEDKFAELLSFGEENDAISEKVHRLSLSLLEAEDFESIRAAIKWIKSIASDPEVGQIYDGTVVKVMEFGAFVNFLGGLDGLVHISEMADHRVNVVTDVVNEGDTVKVKVLEIDGRGKVRLSMKVVDQATGEDQSDQYEMAGKSMRRKRPAGEAQEA